VTAAGIAGIERRQARLRMQMRTIANDPQEKPCPSASRKENGLRSLARPLHRHNCMLRSARVQMGGREHERVPWKHLAAEAAGDGSELPREDLGASRTVPPTPVGVAAGVHEGDALQPRAPRARAQRRITGEVHLDGCRDPSGAGFGFVIVVWNAGSRADGWRFGLGCVFRALTIVLILVLACMTPGTNSDCSSKHYLFLIYTWKNIGCQELANQVTFRNRRDSWK
jgi:hypothetical protein